MKDERLSEDQIVKEVSNLIGWYYNQSVLEKQFLFADFSEALAFIVRVGIISEKLDHHPELYNVYNKVHLKISTHSAQGITQKDFEWIHQVDKLQAKS
ncbi:MAG: 4a-hydroxytetrahydrobiopterin dehydratase [Chitinophagaceae bacterium]|nr:4a-hydroxytetrahydrobiopterin dehydratase [Chitinophagaceae bacterium]